MNRSCNISGEQKSTFMFQGLLFLRLSGFKKHSASTLSSRFNIWFNIPVNFDMDRNFVIGRRQKVGSVLLKACDVLSNLWGFKYLVLRAYEVDVGARRLYTKAGYRVVSSDPQWTTWIGRKRRVLMIKESNLLR